MSTPTLDGAAALMRQLEALRSLDDGKALKRCVKSGINEALKRAQEIIPVGLSDLHRLKTSKALHNAGVSGQTVGPGFARAALRTISTINGEKNVASGLLSVRKAAYYAVAFVELGTRKMHAQPWLRRSLLEARDDAELALRHSLEVSVEKAAKTT